MASTDALTVTRIVFSREGTAAGAAVSAATMGKELAVSNRPPRTIVLRDFFIGCRYVLCFGKISSVAQAVRRFHHRPSLRAPPFKWLCYPAFIKVTPRHLTINSSPA